MFYFSFYLRLVAQPYTRLCILQAYPRDLDVEDLIYQAKRLESTTGAA